MQPQGHLQVLLNILRGMTPQAALDAPRFCISAGLPDADNEDANNQSIGDINSEVYIEEGVPESVVAKLNGECRNAPGGRRREAVADKTYHMQKWDTMSGRPRATLEPSLVVDR